MAAKKFTKRREQAAQTREKVRSSAMDLLSSRGYEQVTVEEICEHAGVSKGTFYVYFKSKDQVILEEYLSIDEHMLSILDELDEDEMSSLEKLTAVHAGVLDYSSALGVAKMKVLYQSQVQPSRVDPVLAHEDRVLYVALEDLMLEAQQSGEVRSDLSGSELVLILRQSLRGLLYTWCLHNGSFDLQEAGENFREVLLEGLKPR